MPEGANKTAFALRYIFNVLRTWYLFHFKFPWVKYKGFVRVMGHTTFAKKNIQLGKNVQFGQFCHIDTNAIIGNNVLVAGRVCFIEKYGHQFATPCETIWNSSNGCELPIIIGDDVWICDGCLLLSGCRIGRGSIVTARSVVTHNIPECEVWGGVPAKKIKDRFKTEHEKNEHLKYLNNLNDENNSCCQGSL